MSLLQLATAKAQAKVTSTAEDVLLQTHLDAAEAHVARYLNRNLYATADAIATATTNAATALAAAQTAYDTASSAWWANPDDCNAPLALAWENACRVYREAKYAARRDFAAMVPNVAITQATLLLFAHFANNRAAVMTENTADSIVLDLGAQTLLDPYRVDEGV